MSATDNDALPAEPNGTAGRLGRRDAKLRSREPGFDIVRREVVGHVSLTRGGDRGPLEVAFGVIAAHSHDGIGGEYEFDYQHKRFKIAVDVERLGD